jgi:hypothetical protein
MREDKEPRGRAGLKSLPQGTTPGGTGVIVAILALAIVVELAIWLRR